MGSNDNDGSSIEQQMESVMALLDARASGQTSSEQVEQAVVRMLESQQASCVPTAPKTPAAVTMAADVPVDAKHNSAESAKLKSQEPEIEQDMENYDDLGEEEPETITPAATAAAAAAATTRPRRACSKRKSASSNTIDNIEVVKVLDLSRYEDIPLGKQGAQMMVTFGDGKNPHPAAVQATLQGARLCLQTAIQDARHIRRKQRKIYRSAKNSLSEKATKEQDAWKSEVSSEMLFRAGEGYDNLAYDPKCGFSSECLRQLFPEEMNAFSRWNEMHEAAEEKEMAESGVGGGTADQDNDTKLVEATAEESTSRDIVGHLQERAAQFDLRTDKMQGEWYLKYSVIRQGSFLPRRRAASGVDAQWENTRKRRLIGERCAGVWSHMSAASVRFLHWVGFDPASALPPPNDDTTNALAFLGHNFYGQIVEKAIFLRNVAKQKQMGQVNEAAVLLELDPGEQLEEPDILRAMQDPDIKPVPLYSGAKTKKLGPQLYFGPGFEDRLEMEMEEMMWNGSCKQALSEEELKIREEEDALFAKLAKPPTQDGIAALLAARKNPGDEQGTSEHVSPLIAKRMRKS